MLDDADLPTAVTCAVDGGYFATGQRCTASSRLIVTEGIHDRLVAARKTRIEALTSSLKHAADFRRKSQAGMVMVNLPTAGVDFHVPFGGRKESSFGPRE